MFLKNFSDVILFNKTILQNFVEPKYIYAQNYVNYIFISVYLYISCPFLFEAICKISPNSLVLKIWDAAPTS
jgi:hypothetical protein